MTPELDARTLNGSGSVSDERFAELRAKHGEVVCVMTRAGDLVFRAPSTQEWKDAVALMAGDMTRRDDAAEKLVRACIVSMPGAEFDALIDDRPGLPEACAPHLFELAGFDEHPDVDAATVDGRDVVTVTTASGTVAFGKPSRPEYRRYLQTSKTPARMHDAMVTLLLACAVEPEASAMGALLGRKPGLALTCVSHVRRLTYAEETASKKK